MKQIPHITGNELEKRTRGLTPTQMRMLSSIYAGLGRQMLRTAKEMQNIKRKAAIRN